MNEKQEALMLECIVDIKNSLHHLSDCTYTGINGGVFFRLAGDPLVVKIPALSEAINNGVKTFINTVDELGGEA